MVSSSSTVIPTLRYRDARGAIDWLCEAFGFERHMVVDDEGRIAHAQLTYRRENGTQGMIMLGDASDDEWGQQVKPAEVLGGNSQSVYVVVDDCRAHYEQAKAAGARIVMDYEEKEYGGAGYGALDPEGVVWSFGSYDPFADEDGAAG